MSLPTPSQSVSHKRFHQCVNHKKKLSLRHPLPTFGSFSFFQASLWLGVDKVLKKLTKFYKSELKNLFQCCILIPRKCPRKTPFQHTVPPAGPQVRRPGQGRVDLGASALDPRPHQISNNSSRCEHVFVFPTFCVEKSISRPPPRVRRPHRWNTMRFDRIFCFCKTTYAIGI